jgi:hypothetical protein
MPLVAAGAPTRVQITVLGEDVIVTVWALLYVPAPGENEGVPAEGVPDAGCTKSTPDSI